MDSCCGRILLAGRFGSVSNDSGWERVRLSACLETVRKRLAGIVTPLVPGMPRPLPNQASLTRKRNARLAAAMDRSW